MAPTPHAPLMSKWSLKTQDHTATRARNNQRRHRARVKARIEGLETELTRSQQELRTARARIAELEDLLATRGSANAVSGHFSAPEPSCQSITEQSLPARELELLSSDLGEQGRYCCPLIPVNRSLGHQHHHRSPTPLPVAGIPTEDPTTSSSLLTDQITASPATLSLITRYGHDGRLPLVAPGESTTLCRVAYEIVAQQNITGIDVSDVEQRLWPGFRRETKQGEGCRVNTKVLYALIDSISPL